MSENVARLSGIAKASIIAAGLSLGLSIAGCDTRASGAAESLPKSAAPPMVAATAAGEKAPPVQAPADPPASGPLKLGAPIVQANTVSLSTLAGQPAKYAKSTVKTEGEVTSVCQAMGCWMEITDKNTDAHIRMSGHGFFIPKTATGRRAVVEGTVLARPDQGECEEEAKLATGKTVKLELDATGVELL
jgi:hypothetical protein